MKTLTLLATLLITTPTHAGLVSESLAISSPTSSWIVDIPDSTTNPLWTAPAQGPFEITASFKNLTPGTRLELLLDTEPFLMITSPVAGPVVSFSSTINVNTQTGDTINFRTNPPHPTPDPRPQEPPQVLLTTEPSTLLLVLIGLGVGLLKYLLGAR